MPPFPTSPPLHLKNIPTSLLNSTVLEVGYKCFVSAETINNLSELNSIPYTAAILDNKYKR